MSERKYISVKEFRELGYLQEVNRLFLHPLGLALSVEVNKETGEERLGPIWDCRDDPEGLAFTDEMAKNEEFKDKADRVAAFWAQKAEVRAKNFGWITQPIAE